MNHAEIVAKVLIEAVVPGSSMEYRPEQSRSVHDFDLCHSDGRISAMEVTASVDQPRQETNAAIFNKRRGGRQIKRQFCNKDWYITPVVGANINKVRENADEYLAAIEASSLERFHFPLEWDPSVDRIYNDLGIVSGLVFQWKEPGYIMIADPGGGGAVGAMLVFDAIRREAFKEDNRAKLAAASTSERHLLVYVHGTTLPWCSLIDCEPPLELPELPPEITDVWALSETRLEREFAVWHASVTSPWRSLGPITLPSQRLEVIRKAAAARWGKKKAKV
jgi:hypothetical protein